MEKLKFESKPEYLDYLEGLVGRCISEIVKLNSSNYIFKIESTWFNLNSETIIRTTFSEGPSLILQAGKNVDEIETLHVKQFKREKRVDKIFEKLEESYIKHLVVSNEKSKYLAKNLLEFLDKCEYIEKYSSNLFIITKGKSKYCYVKCEDFTQGLYQMQIKVKKIIGDNEKVVETIKGDYYVRTIMSFLEFAYYSSRLDNINQIKTMVERHLD